MAGRNKPKIHIEVSRITTETKEYMIKNLREQLTNTERMTENHHLATTTIVTDSRISCSKASGESLMRTVYLHSPEVSPHKLLKLQDGKILLLDKVGGHPCGQK